MQIKQLTETELPDYVRLMSEAYPGMKIVTHEDHEKQIVFLKKRLLDPRVSLWGAYRGDDLVGIMSFHDFTMNVRGQMMGVGGVGSVAVHLMHKKEHIARDLIKFYLNYYRERGISMATLWPFRADFYHKMGFGLGGRMYEYKVRPDSFRAGKSKEHVRFLKREDVSRINECYNRYVRTRSGLTEEIEPYWDLIFEMRQATRFVGCELNGRLEGFMTFSFDQDVPGNFLDNNMKITRLVWNSPEALSQLLAFLRSQADQIHRIVLVTGEDEFYHLLDDPYDASRYEFFPINRESHLAGVGIMYRILDIPGLFEQLAAATFPEIELNIKLQVTDSFFNTGERPCYLRASGGKIICSDSGVSDVEIGLDISEFSSLLMGGLRFETAVNYNLATISDEKLIPAVDRLFGGIRPAYTQAVF